MTDRYDTAVLPLVPVSPGTPQAALAEEIAGILAMEGVLDIMALPVAVRIMAVVQSAITEPRRCKRCGTAENVKGDVCGNCADDLRDDENFERYERELERTNR